MSDEEGNGLTRVTVNLTPRAMSAMVDICGRTGLGKTDVINRALQIYALVEQLIERGEGVLNVVRPDGDVERIYII